MELRQLTYFDAVVRHGGFTRAARELRIAQPALSAQVKRLEQAGGPAPRAPRRGRRSPSSIWTTPRPTRRSA